MSTDQLSQGGQIQDVAHAASKGNLDTLYWIQGGNNIGFSQQTLNRKTDPSQQILRIGQAGGRVNTYSLVHDLGLQLAEGDQWGQQALVYVPATKHHEAQLVIGGQRGIWSSDLDRDGQPIGFMQMNWQGLPDQGPGSYVRSIQYDPDDDLLIAATQGQGSFLYSYSGNLGRRSNPSRLLHVSNLDLHQNPTPVLDKRGNEVQSTITIALDSRLKAASQPTDLRIKLHDAKAWRNAMDYVSPYNLAFDIAEDPGPNPLNTTGGLQMKAATNLLTPEGVATFGGKLNKNTISIPLSMAPGSTMFNLIVNSNEAEIDKRTRSLKYSVGLADGSEKLTRRVKFIPFSNSNKTQRSRNSLQRTDNITEVDGSQFSLLDPTDQVNGSLAGRLKVTSQSDHDLVCGVYWVQSSDGSVMTPDGALLQPGDNGYAAAALRDGNLGAELGSLLRGESQSQFIQKRDGAFLAPFAKTNDEIFFAFGATSADGRDHFKLLAPGLIGLEDYALDGMVDFKDTLMSFDQSVFN